MKFDARSSLSSATASVAHRSSTSLHCLASPTASIASSKSCWTASTYSGGTIFSIGAFSQLWRAATIAGPSLGTADAMIGLLQRVGSASVVVEGRTIGAIARGILVFVGVQRGDTDAQADRLAERLLTYRVFPDEQGKMNR